MMKKIFSNFYYYLFFIFVNLTIFLDSYKYPGFFKKHFFLDSKILFILFIISSIFLLFKNKSLFQSKFFKIFNTIFFIVSLFLMALFSYLEFSHYENYVYNLFHINHTYFSLFFIEGFILFIFSFGNLLKRRINTLLVLFFLFFFLLGLFSYTFQLDFFIKINKEDQIIENLQFLIILFSSIFSLFLAQFYKKQKNYFLFIFYIMGSLALLFVAGDEISWGQRLFDYHTPHSIIEFTDQQNEISIHNTKRIAKHMGQIYLIISAYGSFSFVIYEFLKKIFKNLNPLFKHFFVLMPASLFFSMKFLYDALNTFSDTDYPFKFDSWSEYVELSMYLGIFIQLFLIYFKQIKKQKK